MRFQVPQFTEIEDKIFGPLTFKQFVYLLGGGGGVFILYKTLPFILAIILAAPIAAFSLALAFHKVNGQPFIKVAENAFRYFTSNKLYLWKKKTASTKTTREELKNKTPLYIPKLTKNKLDDLAWSLDIREKINR